jgi:hypothetical protein
VTAACATILRSGATAPVTADRPAPGAGVTTHRSG